MNESTILADDLFAGAGGWDVGARALGINGRGIENMKEARATREAAGLETIHDDVWTFVPDGKAGISIASPPCQTFSAAGSGAGRRALDDVLALILDSTFADLDRLRAGAEQLGGDERTALVLTPLHFATQHDYDTLAWEQVPTVLPVWEACAEVLRGQGWNVWTGLVYAEQYGVPQTRKRAVLIASRTREVGRPKPTHSRYHVRTPGKLDEGVAKWVSMAEALNFSKALPTHMGDVYNSKGCIRSVDEPAPTMTGSMDNGNFRWFDERNPPPKLANRMPAVEGSTGQSTPVRIEEAGVLQSFPPDYPWQGAKGKTFLQAGNAVPPLMALHILAEAMGFDL